MTRDERPNPSPHVIFQKRFLAPTSTLNGNIGFTWKLLCFPVWQSMAYTMMKYRGFNSQILRAIVCPVFIQMMRLFSLAQRAAQQLHGHQVMLIGIAMGLPQRVSWRDSHKYISVRTDRATTFPVRVPYATAPLIRARSARKGCRLFGAATFGA